VVVGTEPVASAPPVAVAGTPYAHAADYSWLSGVVEKGRHQDVLLRFAPEDVGDRFGGIVTLVFYDVEADRVRPGDVVRVEGVFLDPEAAAPHAGYRVSSVKPLARP
jgi:hypothetical protein